MEARPRVTTSQLARLLGQWTGPGRGLSRDLATALRELIQLEELAPGAQLPSERGLAEALAVSRTTVLTAYATLRDESLIDRRMGSGTWIASRQGTEGHVALNGRRGEDRVARYFVDSPTTVIDLTNAAVPGLPLVAQVAGRMTERDFAPLVDSHGYDPLGLPELRMRIAHWYSSSGVPTTAEQIIITSGAQQAFELATNVLLRPGDLVLADDPTFRSAVQRLRSIGVRLHAIPMDEGGSDVAAMEQATAVMSPQMIYVMSSVHNPTGATTTPERARRLAAFARRTRTLIVDDASLATTSLGGGSAEPLVGFDNSEWILTIGSFSKIFWGGLRLGWVRAAPRIIHELATTKAVADLGSSQVSQLVALQLFPHLDEAIRERRERLTSGLERLSGLLSQSLPSWSWKAPYGGSSLWVRLPFPCAVAFAEFARRQGVYVIPGPVFSPTESFDDRLRLPFGLKPGVTEAGVKRLRVAWDGFTDQHRQPEALPQRHPYV